MTDNKLVAVVGMCGSGKSVLSDALVAENFGYLRFGQIVMDEIKKKNLEVSESNERIIREGFRKEYGMGAFAVLNIPKFDELLQQSHVVGDGLYSWDEYKILKEKYGDNLIVVAVYAPPPMRYERLEKRFSDASDTALRNRGFSREAAAARDIAEIENIAKGGPIAMADYTILNIGTMEEYREQIKKFIDWLKKYGNN
ncbi:MAG: Dephospho-CoA kinase [Candidatus Uhrbacteria bacterium GW2011_GWE2_45_35]|uniref:Dephospho-CoA kinase n=1 Tax=Candidatus Uhrbacteria bacterium GW2011_GWE2_45_35 TaxID=1618993 RepID=A0A0G1ML27_9BACT|nr:MAG: Dephospho-CoA kinase [Candidatus Uhrbacteria bacterium GW2011_GWE2_45_35]HBR80968.1 dephospho-CoA kinase [Candidatus Uhrbacteria bacterium]HCU31917.1 dephospho-CoA kinase [Candidatus Uhrbacteria bacterium]